MSDYNPCTGVGIGVPVLAVKLTTEQATLWGAGLVKSLTRETWRAVVLGAGFAEGSAVFGHVEHYFSARAPAHRELLLGRRGAGSIADDLTAWEEECGGGWYGL